MGFFKTKFKVEGMEKLINNLKKLGQVPQKHVTASVKKAMRTPYSQAKEDAPYLTGALHDAITLKGEKSKIKGKKVYRIVFDDSMNEQFQYKRTVTNKRTKKETERVTGYYPVSQEYGWFAVNGRYIPGQRFVRGAMEENSGKVKKIIMDTMGKKIEMELRKVGLRP